MLLSPRQGSSVLNFRCWIINRASFTQAVGRDAHANSNANPLMLLACSVNTPIDNNRSHLPALRCTSSRASCVNVALANQIPGIHRLDHALGRQTAPAVSRHLKYSAASIIRKKFFFLTISLNFACLQIVQVWIWILSFLRFELSGFQTAPLANKHAGMTVRHWWAGNFDI